MENKTSLVEWISSNGGYIHEGIDLFASIEGRDDRGVVARSEIKKGEQLMLIPEKISIYVPSDRDQEKTYDRLGNPKILAVLSDLEGARNPSPFILAVLHFLAEDGLGSESSFYPYFSSLPESCPPVLMTWTDDELKLLEGTSVEGNCDRKMFEETYRDVIKPVINSHRDIWIPSFCTFERALRAASLVQSRVFHMKEENWITNVTREGSQLYLIPGIDMINHSHTKENINTELAKCKDVMTVEISEGNMIEIDGYFTMKAERNIAEGEEILHSYGELGNASLFRIYGFLPEESIVNPYSFLKVRYSVIKEACFRSVARLNWPLSRLEAKETFLSERFGSVMADMEFHLLWETLVPDEFLTVVQVLLLPENDFLDITREADLDREVFALGKDFIDDSDWSDAVIMALLEIAETLCNTNCNSVVEHNSSGLVRQEAVDLALKLTKEEQNILSALRKEILSLVSGPSEDMEYSEDSDSREG